MCIHQAAALALPAALPRRIAVGVALDGNDMRMMQRPIHRHAGQEHIAEECRALLDGPIRGEKGGAALIALPNDLLQVLRLLVAQRAQPQIVDDQQMKNKKNKEEQGHP